VKRNLKVLVADDESIRVLSLKAQLLNLGIETVAEASNGREAVEMAREFKPDLVIMDIKMPELDGIEAAKMITAERPVPIVLLTAYSERELAERATEAGVMSYLMKPVSEADLLPAVLLATSRFTEFQLLRRENDSLKEALETRKLVERAKGILMQRRRLGEADAFRLMQQQSQNENKKLVEIARAIITADRML
jgi:response regulator NasT